jgi:hypothetical protein
MALGVACGARADDLGPRAAVPGEALVQFRPGTEPERIVRILEEAEAQIDKPLGMPLAYAIRFPDRIPVEEMLRRLRAYPEVQLAEPNYRVYLNPPGRTAAPRLERQPPGDAVQQ